jgi:sugar fermentation stimulation protein A
MIPGKFIKRYKRFFVDIELENKDIVTAHCPNTGSMKSCIEPGWKVLLTKSNNLKRKLKYTLEVVLSPQGPIMVNTIKSNEFVFNYLTEKSLPELVKYPEIQREVKVGDSRIDFKLSNERQDYYLEVKSVTYLKDSTYLFPDSVTTRGQKHLKTLTTLSSEKHKSGILFLVNREGASTFSFAKEIDPHYYQLAMLAKENGVDFLCYHNKWSNKEFSLGKKIPILF